MMTSAQTTSTINSHPSFKSKRERVRLGDRSKIRGARTQCQCSGLQIQMSRRWLKKVWNHSVNKRATLTTPTLLIYNYPETLFKSRQKIRFTLTVAALFYSCHHRVNINVYVQTISVGARSHVRTKQSSLRKTVVNCEHHLTRSEKEVACADGRPLPLTTTCRLLGCGTERVAITPPLLFTVIIIKSFVGQQRNVSTQKKEELRRISSSRHKLTIINV